MAVRHLLQLRPVQHAQHRLDQVVTAPIPSSVHCFEGIEQNEQLFEMIQSKPVVDAVERVGARMSDLFLPKVVAQFIDVFTQALDLSKLSLTDAPHQYMNLASIFG